MRVALLLLVLLGAAPSRAERELAVYPGAVHTRIGTELRIGGQSHRMAYFTTRDSLARVARYFHASWTAEGYPVELDGDLEQQAVVSAFSTREGLQRSVVLRTHLGKTVGFSVLKDLWWSETSAAASARRFMPVEGALFSVDVGTRDDAGGAHHRAQVVERGLDEVRRALLTRLSAAGYRAVRESGGPWEGRRTLVLEFTRGAEQLLTTLVELEPSRVAVSQTWVGSEALEEGPAAGAGRPSREAPPHAMTSQEKRP